MDAEPKWLEREAVLLIHGRLIGKYGGSHGLRDEGLFESALGRPRNRFAYDPDADIFSLAAAYGYGLALNHPFIDGNKRTALVSMEMFLGDNGHRLSFHDEDAAYGMITALASGKMKEAELTAWLEKNCARTA